MGVAFYLEGTFSWAPKEHCSSFVLAVISTVCGSKTRPGRGPILGHIFLRKLFRTMHKWYLHLLDQYPGYILAKDEVVWASVAFTGRPSIWMPRKGKMPHVRGHRFNVARARQLKPFEVVALEGYSKVPRLKSWKGFKFFNSIGQRQKEELGTSFAS